MSPTRPRFRYDVFLSYSHHNRAWVRDWLVPQLQQVGLTVCIDYASFTPGAPSITEIERTVLQSRKIVCILTPEYLQSGWTEFENLLVQTPDPAARQQRLIPLLLSPCAPPLRLGMLTHIDFSRDEARKLNRLYQRPLKRQGHIEALMDVIGGHPYLLRQALYVLATRTASLPNLLNTDGADNGPFADHLQHYWRILAAEPTLRQGMQQAITNGTCADYGVFLHLRALGLVTGTSHRTVSPRCRLYATYFQRVLS